MMDRLRRFVAVAVATAATTVVCHHATGHGIEPAFAVRRFPSLDCTHAFPNQRQATKRCALESCNGYEGESRRLSHATRRSVFEKMLVCFGGSLLWSSGLSVAAAESGALPSVTLQQFESIVRESARSVSLVEFTGKNNANVVVTLLDGTQFTLSDVEESPTDPRSPLQVAALCRSYGITARFPTLEATLKKSESPRKKQYANTRVLEAAKKEREKELRLQQYERERLAELYKRELEEDAKKAAAAASFRSSGDSAD